MVFMRKMAELQGLVLLSNGRFAHAVNLIRKDYCRLPICVYSLRGCVEVAVYFPRYPRTRAAFQSDHATLAATGHRVGQLLSFRAIKWVGHSSPVHPLQANVPGLRPVLLSSAHDQNGSSVPLTVAATITDGEVEAPVKSCLPFLTC